jgi:hypothetical protein
LLWSRRVHGPHPLIIAERPSELIPNAAMFHDASRECPPARSPNFEPKFHPRRWSFRPNEKLLLKSSAQGPPSGDHAYIACGEKMKPAPVFAPVLGGGGKRPRHYGEETGLRDAGDNAAPACPFGTFSATRPLFETISRRQPPWP